MDFGIPGLKQQTNKQFEVRKMLERKKSLFVFFCEKVCLVYNSKVIARYSERAPDFSAALLTFVSLTEFVNKQPTSIF